MVDNGKIGASSLWKWYSVDFGRNDGEIISHIWKFASFELHKRPKEVLDISVYHYDFSLNDTR